MTTRKISKPAVSYLIKREGGMRLDVHDDGFGYPTVGVGHLVLDRDKLKLGDKISKKRAKDFLQNDLLWARKAVNRYVNTPLAQHEFDALVIFCFNVGQSAFAGSTLVKRLNNFKSLGDIAKHEMPRWNKAKGQFIRGLYNRRIDTSQMFAEADYKVDWSGLTRQV